jgi:hypothetical protein
MHIRKHTSTYIQKEIQTLLYTNKYTPIQNHLHTLKKRIRNKNIEKKNLYKHTVSYPIQKHIHLTQV